MPPASLDPRRPAAGWSCTGFLAIFLAGQPLGNQDAPPPQAAPTPPPPADDSASAARELSLQAARETLTLPPWPDVLLRLKHDAVGIQNPFDPREEWRTLEVPEGSLAAHLETRTLSSGTVQRILVLPADVELWMSRDALTRVDEWSPSFGELVRLPTGPELPAIARDDTGSAWVWSQDGARLAHNVEVVTTADAPDATAAPRPRQSVRIGDSVLLACSDTPLVDPTTNAPLSLPAEGTATVTGGTGGQVEVLLESGVLGRAPATCGAEADLVVSTLTGPARIPRAGQPTLVHFWASWCRPCVAELPEFVHFQQAVGGERAIAVSEDFKPSAAENFLFDRGIEMPSAFDHEAQLLGALGGEQVLPYTVLVDGRGEVLETWTGKTDWADPALFEKLGLPVPAPQIPAAADSSTAPAEEMAPSTGPSEREGVAPSAQDDDAQQAGPKDDDDTPTEAEPVPESAEESEPRVLEAILRHLPFGE